MQETLLEKAQRLGIKPAGSPSVTSSVSAPQAQESLLQKAQRLGIKPQGVQTQPTDNRDLLQKTGDIVNSIFPGKQIGTVIGSTAQNIYQGVKNVASGKDFFDNNNMDLGTTPLRVAGDVAQGALTVAAPGVGRGAGVLGRIGANAALGAGLGGTNAIAEGGSTGDVAKGAALGGALGGGVSAATEGIGALVNNLPKWLVKTVLPKLKGENVDYALANTKVGTVSTMLQNSKEATQSYENQVQSILSHPEFKAVAADTPSILQDTVKTFPNSEYRPEDIIKNAKQLAPEVKSLITKFEAGQADVQEVNTIRKALDKATQSVYTSLNRPPESKALGAALANSMREFVKDTAEETRPIFDNYAKEVDLKKALTSLSKKTGDSPINFKDIVAAGSGFAHSGFKGALEAIILERGLMSPGGRMAAAKAINAVGKSTPAVGTLIRGAKAPLIKAATSLPKQPTKPFQ